MRRNVTYEDTYTCIDKRAKIFNNKKKRALTQYLLLRESLEIRRQKTTRGLGLNDPQLCVWSNAWDPILKRLSD